MFVEPSAAIPLTTMVVAVASWGLIVRFRFGDIIGPFSIAVLLIGSIYGVRPLLMLGSNDFGFYGLDTASGFNGAALAGFLFLVMLVFGYLVSSSHRRPVDLDKASRCLPAVGMVGASLIGISLAVVSVAITISRGQGLSLSLLFAGRNDGTRAAIAGLPVAVAAMPTAAALLVAVVRITIERSRSLNPSEHLSFWVTVLVATVPPLALGNRRFLLPSLVAALIAVSASRFDRRIKPITLLTSAFGLLALAILPFVRSTGSRSGSGGLLEAMQIYFSENGIRGSLEPFFKSYDTEMFNYVAYLEPRLGNGLPYGLGRGTIGDAIIAPIPAAWGPPTTWSDQLLTSAFGGGCGTLNCPVPSVVGVSLYDFGMIGVVVAGFLLGLLMSSYRTWLTTLSGAKLALLVSIASFSPVLVRGNTINVGYIAVTCWAMVSIVLLVSRTLTGTSQRRGGRVPAREPEVRASSLAETAPSGAGV